MIEQNVLKYLYLSSSQSKKKVRYNTAVPTQLIVRMVLLVAASINSLLMISMNNRLFDNDLSMRALAVDMPTCC